MTRDCLETVARSARVRGRWAHGDAMGLEPVAVA